MVTTPLHEKKSLTKEVEKGTYKLADKPFMKKKSSTKYVEKSTDELADIKQEVVTIQRRGLYQFEGQSRVSKGWFKIDIGLNLFF